MSFTTRFHSIHFNSILISFNSSRVLSSLQICYKLFKKYLAKFLRLKLGSLINQLIRM